MPFVKTSQRNPRDSNDRASPEEYKTETVFTVPGYCFLLEGLAGPNWASTNEDRDTRRVKRLLKRATLLYQAFPVMRPRIDRGRGRVLRALGRTQHSKRCLQRAVDNGRKFELGYERARSLLDLAAVKEEGRDENRAEAIELLKKLESVIPRAESWLLGDQYDEEVVAPEFDLEAWEREHGPISPQIDAEKV